MLESPDKVQPFSKVLSLFFALLEVNIDLTSSKLEFTTLWQIWTILMESVFKAIRFEVSS